MRERIAGQAARDIGVRQCEYGMDRAENVLWDDWQSMHSWKGTSSEDGVRGSALATSLRAASVATTFCEIPDEAGVRVRLFEHTIPLNRVMTLQKLVTVAKSSSSN